MQSAGCGGCRSKLLYVFTLMKCKRCSVLSLLISALIGSGNVSVSVYLGLKSIIDTLSITVLRSSGDNSIDKKYRR